MTSPHQNHRNMSQVPDITLTSESILGDLNTKIGSENVFEATVDNP